MRRISAILSLSILAAVPPAGAQQVGVETGWMWYDQPTMPEGPAALLALSWDPVDYLRFDLRGGGTTATERGKPYVSYGCFEGVSPCTEQVQTTTTLRGWEALAFVLTAPMEGLRFGAGMGYTRYDARVVTVTERTDFRWLTDESNRLPPAPTYAVMTTFSPPAAPRLVVEARLLQAMIHVRGCPLQGGAICQDLRVRRISLGLAYRPGRQGGG